MAKQEEAGWMSVPQFGGWESKAAGATDYSMVFSRARANKKQQKTEIKNTDKEEFINPLAPPPPLHHHVHHDDSVNRKRKILTYINCCIKP
ncbi:RPM1-interacting protein 4 (RIN4) family protein [Euphorbia peplus]|nr:RPM1-interacting protein 4 (RIN4) family protein [Euphorbia peplus]